QQLEAGQPTFGGEPVQGGPADQVEGGPQQPGPGPAGRRLRGGQGGGGPAVTAVTLAEPGPSPSVRGARLPLPLPPREVQRGARGRGAGPARLAPQRGGVGVAEV